MRVDSTTMARARLAVRQAVSAHLFDPNVTMIDFGNREHEGKIAADELTIRVHVRKKLTGLALEAAVEAGRATPIPPFIGGFPTDVPEGIYRLHLAPALVAQRRAVNRRATRNDPLRGGISISDEFHNAFGTLGGIVYDRATGQAMILSNWHVLVAAWTARPGQRIYQPGRLDSGTRADTVATLTRDAMRIGLDAAVATLNGERRYVNDQMGVGAVTGLGKAELGMELVKSGRRTGVTYGVVTAIEGVARIRYAGIDRMIRQVVTIEPLNFGEVSAAGDSGSFWLDREAKQAIGLHFAGSDKPERGLAIDMQSVLDALNADLTAQPEARTTASSSGLELATSQSRNSGGCGCGED